MGVVNKYRSNDVAVVILTRASAALASLSCTVSESQSDFIDVKRSFSSLFTDSICDLSTSSIPLSHQPTCLFVSHRVVIL